MSAIFYRTYVKKSLELSLPSDILRERLLALKTVEDLALQLDCSLQQLTYWTSVAPRAERYRTFEIPKADGTRRMIEAPSPVLMVLQRKLLQLLEAVYEPRAPAHGFIKERSILTNARPHSRRAWVLNLDLSDFFWTFNFGRVRGIFQAKPFSLPEPVARAIACLSCLDGRLPQGAPTSPIISNIICSKMDGELRRLAHSAGAVYTRYADDITFSVRRRAFPQVLASISEDQSGVAVASLSETLVSVISENGFTINPKKTRIQPRARSQRVTGLVVNKKINLPRKFIRRTRAMLHAWERYGVKDAHKEFLARYAAGRSKDSKPPSFKRTVRGHIAFIGQVRGKDDGIYLRMLSKYHVLIGKPLVGVPVAMTNNSAQRDVFVCHASEDKKSIVEPLVRVCEAEGISVWFDKAQIAWGDSLTEKINEGLASSQFVLVVISSSFMKKKWPQKELNASLAKEIGQGMKRVLPLMAGTTSEVSGFLHALPLQADKLYLTWEGDPKKIVDELKGVLGGTP